MLLFVISMQIRITYMIKEKEYLFNDPLVYSAKMYDIPECACFVSDTQTLFFNQSKSWYVITHNKINYKFDKNITNFFVK